MIQSYGIFQVLRGSGPCVFQVLGLGRTLGASLQLDWTIGLDNWVGQLDGTTGWDNRLGQHPKL
jgi:hypothetical protein